MNIAKWHSSRKQTQRLQAAETKVIDEVYGPYHTEVNGTRRLNADTVRAIRASTLPIPDIAEQYGIRKRKVRSIKDWKTYRSVR